MTNQHEERARPSEEWLFQLLYRIDPMCGREDCLYTARELWPHIEAALAGNDAGREATIEECAKVAEGCPLHGTLAPGILDGISIATRQIAAAIRALARHDEKED